MGPGNPSSKNHIENRPFLTDDMSDECAQNLRITALKERIGIHPFHAGGRIRLTVVNNLSR
ncbi:hypothetical protein D3C76_1081360 [compost metagenome]